MLSRAVGTVRSTSLCNIASRRCTGVRWCHKLSIPLEKYVEQIEVRMVDRQNKYEKYHDTIFDNLKKDLENFRNTAAHLLEDASKDNGIENLKKRVDRISHDIERIESGIGDAMQDSRQLQATVDRFPSLLEATVSKADSAKEKEIDMLKEALSTLREDKKKEVGNLKAEISALREEMKNEVIALKADIKASRKEYKSDMHSSLSMMYYRLLFGVFGAAAMGIAAIQSLGSLAKIGKNSPALPPEA